jgi:hypothetical protein
MLRSIPFYWFEREDYERVRCLIPNDKQIPGSFDEWEEAATKQIAELEARGIDIRKVIVDPTEYSVFCEANGLERCIASLGTFVVERSRK